MRILTLSALLLGLLSLQAQSQDYPLSEDVESIDGIIKAYYEVVSGPAGQERDWDRDKSLHIPEAQVIILASNPDAESGVVPRVMTLEQYHQGAGSLSESGFFEVETNRIVHRHGAMAQVWSSYEFRFTEDGDVAGEGINTISLFHDGSRWWITSWMFDGRSEAGPVPPEYKPGN